MRRRELRQVLFQTTHGLVHVWERSSDERTVRRSKDSDHLQGPKFDDVDAEFYDGFASIGQSGNVET